MTCLLQSAQLVVLDHLLKAELQVLEQVAQLVLVGLLELSVLQAPANISAVAFSPTGSLFRQQ